MVMQSLSPHCASAGASSIAWLALLFALATHVAHAELTVQPQAPQTSPLTMTWTISTSSDDPTDSLRALSINSLGKVFVSYDPGADTSMRSATQAIVRATGDDETSVDAVTVASTSDDGGQHKLQLYVGHDDVVTEIILTQPYQLQHISALGHGDVVIGDRVLAASSADASSTIQIDTSGSGDVFVVATDPLKATSVAFSNRGPGNLQIEAHEFHFENLTVKNFAADADIKLLSSSSSSSPGSTVTKASFSMSSSGTICWDFPDLHVGNLEVSMAGSGTIGATAAASCDAENIKIFGSGDVKLGTVSCQSTKVTIMGSGAAVVQASQYLGGVITGSGDVKYTGQQPLAMSDKYGQVAASSSSRSFKAIAKSSMSAPGLKCTKKPVPSLKTQMKRSSYVREPPPSDLPGGPAGGESHQIDYQPPVASISESVCPACTQIWIWTKANSIVVVSVGVFVVFWIVTLALSRRERRQRLRSTRRRDPEQQYLLGHDRVEAREGKPVYV